MELFLERRVHVDDTSIRLWEGGSGAPLLFLHGGGGIAPLLPSLESLARSYRVIVPEHPGFGLSDFPEWMDTVSDLVIFYRQLADLLQLDSFHLGGHGLGGWIAAEFAVHYSHRLRSLTLVDALGIRVEGVAMADIFIMSTTEVPELLWHRPERAPAPTPANPSAIRVLTRNSIAMARLAWERSYNPKLQRQLQVIKTPTLVLWGEEDRLIPVAYGDAWAASIPGAKFITIKDCGHLPPSEQPDRFVNEVSAFIGKGV